MFTSNFLIGVVQCIVYTMLAVYSYSSADEVNQMHKCPTIKVRKQYSQCVLYSMLAVYSCSSTDEVNRPRGQS